MKSLFFYETSAHITLTMLISLALKQKLLIMNRFLLVHVTVEAKAFTRIYVANGAHTGMR